MNRECLGFRFDDDFVLIVKKFITVREIAEWN
jgi:hypothetical protein